MEIRKYKYYDKKCYFETLENGLRVFVIPTNDVTTTAHVFVNFGNEDVLGTIDGHLIPNGVAHFLEHRLFDYKGLNVMDLFQDMNCNTNAYTCAEFTTYFFDTNDKNIKDPLNLLLNMTDTCEMSLEAFENEKGIIINEFNMGNDNPIKRAYSELRKNTFGDHPYGLDTIGTVDSIKNTKLEDLVRIHHYFYRPDNKIVVVTGNVNPKKTINIVKKNQAKKVWENSGVFVPYTPKKVKHIEESFMELEIPKDKTMIELVLDKKYFPKDQNLFRILTTSQILLKLLFSKSSKFFNENKNVLFDQNSLSAYSNIKPDFIEISIIADTIKTKEFIDAIKNVIHKPDSYIDYAQFKAYKNADIESTLSLDEYSNELCDDFGRCIIEHDFDAFLDIEAGMSVTIDDVRNMAKIIKKGEFTILKCIAKK